MPADAPLDVPVGPSPAAAPPEARGPAGGERLVELDVSGVAAGGDGVARPADGTVVFVHGALPGERVRARVDEERVRFRRATAVSVLRASPDRRTPPCPYVAAGCGGCDWQHVEPTGQRALRRQVVVDALGRIGGLGDVEVVDGPPLDPAGGRTTVRAAVVDGRAGFRRHHSHDVVAVERCLVSHPLVSEVLAEGRFPGASEVTIRVGARTGERLVVVHPTAAGTQVPDGVAVVGTDELRRGRRAWYHEEVAGRRWRISASSFFQARPDGAEALVGAAEALVQLHAPAAERLVDLCAGVGLFAGTLGAGRRVVAVERHRPAVADARVNLADLEVRLVRSAFADWRPSEAEVVVADPARSGLGRAGVDVVAKTGAGLVVLVSCDPASLGRDAGLLVAAGYDITATTLVELFPETSHVEAVTGFVRTG